MCEAYIKSATAILKIVMEEKVLSMITKDDFFTSYIPSVNIINKENIADSIDAIIKIEEGKQNKISIDYPHIYYEYEKLNIKDIISLIEFVLERARQEKGIICIHGAGAVVNNKLVTCWGTATGMGKTTLAIELAENNNLFYSDEKILIDLKNRKAVGRIRKQYLSNKYWNNKYGQQDYYEQKNISEDEIYDIGMFIQPIICNQEEYIFDEWEQKKFVWHLYEESSRKIRGTSRIFFDNTYPAQSLDTEKLALKRLELIKEFAKSIQAVYFKGTAEKAINIINQQL